MNDPSAALIAALHRLRNASIDAAQTKEDANWPESPGGLRYEYAMQDEARRAAREFDAAVAAMTAKAAAWDGQSYEDAYQFAYCELCDLYDEDTLIGIEEALREAAKVRRDEALAASYAAVERALDKARAA